MSTDQSRELTITIQDMSVIRADASTGQTAFGKLDLPPLHRRLVQVFEHWLGMDQVTRMEDLEALGSLLFQAIINGEIYQLFDSLRKTASKSQRLRLQLSFQEPAFEIASYPWEFLFCPETETRRGFFLATESELVLSRYMPLETDRKGDLQSSSGTLRILIVVSSPEGLIKVIAPPVIEAIQKLETDFAVQIVVEKQPSVERFLEALEKNKPDVLHFLGHAQFNPAKNQGEIALLDDDLLGPRWVPDRLFAEFFSQMQAIPQLVILHSCEGGANQFDARFAGLAPQLVRNDIQAVVAMQYPILNKAAILFSKAFYRELARGAAVDSATQSGRYAICLDPDFGYDSRVFGTPMLWMRSRSGVILPPAIAKDTQG
jgi:hypothetical protein